MLVFYSISKFLVQVRAEVNRPSASNRLLRREQGGQPGGGAEDCQEGAGPAGEGRLHRHRDQLPPHGCLRHVGHINELIQSNSSQVIGCMTLTKGPQEKATEDGHGPRKKKARHQAVEKKKYKKMAIRKGEKREKEAKMEKAVIRAIPTGEFYAVHNWRPPARAHLSEEENAVYEAGDREDATANDTRSWETGSQHSGPERTLQEKIRDWEDGPLPIEMDDVPAENKKTATQASIARAQPTTPPVEQPKEEKKSVAVKVLTTPKREEPVPQPLPAMAPAEQSKEKKKSSPKKRMSTKSLTVQPKEEKEITPGEVPAPPKKEEVVSHYLHAPLAQLNVEQKPVAVEEPLPPKKTEGVPQYLPAPVEQLKEEKSMPVEVPPKKEETIAQPLPIVVEQPREEKKPAAVEEPAPRQKKEVVSQYLHAPLAQLNVEQKPAAVEEPAPPKKEQLVSQYLPALVEQPKEEKKPVPVEEPAPSKKEEILSKVDVAPVEQLPNTPAAEQPKEEKKLVAAEAQTTPEVPPVPAAGWMEMKAGAKGKTEALLTVRAHK